MSESRANAGPIGGAYCLDPLDPRLLPQEAQELGEHEREALWRLFVEIGRCWDDVRNDSANLKSSWTEFIEAKTTREPTYIAEYSNAVSVVEELVELYGESNAYTLLLLRSGVPDGPPTTRIAHAKRYVVDEFIRVQVVASGFKSWGGRNYKGYIGGSRYNEKARVRAYVPLRTRRPHEQPEAIPAPEAAAAARRRPEVVPAEPVSAIPEAPVEPRPPSAPKEPR